MYAPLQIVYDTDLVRGSVMAASGGRIAPTVTVSAWGSGSGGGDYAPVFITTVTPGAAYHFTVGSGSGAGLRAVRP